MPGGGGEILDDEIRNDISPLKCKSEEWLMVHREAHKLGLRTTAHDDDRRRGNDPSPHQSSGKAPRVCRTKPAASRHSFPGRSSPNIPNWRSATFRK